MSENFDSNKNQNYYEEPSVVYVGDTNQSANARSLIKAGYAILVAAAAVAVAAGGGLWVYGAAWLWCDPYW